MKVLAAQWCPTYILGSNPLSDMGFVEIFSLSVGCFLLLIVSLMHRILKYHEAQFVSFVICDFMSNLRSDWQNLML